MNLKKLEDNLKYRDLALTKLDSMSKEQIEELMVKMQIDHQKIIFEEGKKEETKRRELRNIRKQIEEQENKVKSHLQIVYKSKLTSITAKPPVLKNAIAAFIVGGLICSLGQIVLNAFAINGYQASEAAMMASIFLIIISSLLTGFGVYDEIGKFAGAGSMVPITGFANSIVSSALEFKREGYIAGVGAKIFTIAGPVLLYGALVSTIIGLIYYIIL